MKIDILLDYHRGLIALNETTSVLHVEDEVGFAEVVAESLSRVDKLIVVTTETDPRRALERLRKNPDAVDCIVSDYNMPGMDGLELLNTVREEWPEIPFILFTGKGSEHVASMAISAGVYDYLQKGSGAETYGILANRIRNAVEHRRAREDTARLHRFLEKVLERATDVIAVVDVNRHVVFTSRSTEAILGYPPDKVREVGPFQLVHPGDREMVERHFEERLLYPEHPTGISVRTRHRRGHYIPTRVRAYNLTNDRDIGGVLIYMHEPRSGETD